MERFVSMVGRADGDSEPPCEPDATCGAAGAGAAGRPGRGLISTP